MPDTRTRRLFRLIFRLMSYRVARIPVPAQGGVLAGVTVVNPGGERAECRTLVISGDRIARLEPAHPAGGSLYAGMYVLPGLIDMHVHVGPPMRDLMSLLFLAHGVTTIRETGDADGTTFDARRRVNAGQAPGPRVLASGPVLDGDPPFLPTSWRVRDASEARMAVAELAALGVDFVKVHHTLSAEALASIRSAAAEHRLKVVGHIPTSVAFEDAHIWDVQHLDGLVPYPGPGETVLDVQRRWRDLSPAAIDAYVRVSAQQGLVHTPTLVCGERLAQAADAAPPAIPAARYMPRYVRDIAWDVKRSLPALRRFTPETLAVMREGLARSREVVRRLQLHGVRLHTGTDTAGMPFVVPGASLHEELGHFVDAGLTAEQAWIAATSAPAESLGVPGLGRVAAGMLADLAIFRADPTRDVAALSTLEAVVAQGRLYTRAALYDALEHHRRAFESPLYERLSMALTELGMRQMARSGL